MKNTTPTAALSVTCESGKTVVTAQVDGALLRLNITQADGKHTKTVALQREDLERLVTHLRWAMPKVKKSNPGPFDGISEIVNQVSPQIVVTTPLEAAPNPGERFAQGGIRIPGKIESSTYDGAPTTE
jgi:hypothetical protein